MILNCLVVEDEEFVRKGIVYKIDWDRLNLRLAGEAENGLDALSLIEKEDIHIVITDIRMPGMDGMDLIEKIKAKREKTRFVIVSGYSEFEYAKKALSFNVSDYILKPIKGAQLERTLVKMRDEILAERMDALYRSSLENMYHANSRLVCSYYLHRLLQDNMPDAELQKCRDKLAEEYVLPYFQVSILKLIPVLPKQNVKTLHNHKDFEKMFDCLSDVYAPYNIRVFNDIKNAYEWILLHNTDRELPDSQNALHQKTIALLRESFGVDVIVGMGMRVTGLDQVKQSYSAASFAVKEAIIKGVNTVIDCKNVDNHVKKINWLSDDDEKTIVSYLENMNPGKLKEFVASLIKGLSHWELKINHLAHYNLALEILVVLRKYMQRNCSIATPETEAEPEFVSELTACCTQECVIKWCMKCIDWYEGFYASEDSASGRELLMSIRKYIVNNYGQDITLNSIAEKFHISPNYLSHTFKVYSDESFKSFLTKLRMEKAIELIMNSDLKLYNIAEIVGYTDPKYFSKVFKGYFGFSPSNFNEE